MKKTRPTALESFIRGFGIEELARRLGVNPSAVSHWLSGSNSLRPTNARKIQALAKQRGVPLTLDDIYRHFRDVQSERYTAESLKLQSARV